MAGFRCCTGGTFQDALFWLNVVFQVTSAVALIFALLLYTQFFGFKLAPTLPNFVYIIAMVYSVVVLAIASLGLASATWLNGKVNATYCVLATLLLCIHLFVGISGFVFAADESEDRDVILGQEMQDLMEYTFGKLSSNSPADWLLFQNSLMCCGITLKATYFYAVLGESLEETLGNQLSGASCENLTSEVESIHANYTAYTDEAEDAFAALVEDPMFCLDAGLEFVREQFLLMVLVYVGFTLLAVITLICGWIVWWTPNYEYASEVDPSSNASYGASQSGAVVPAVAGATRKRKMLLKRGNDDNASQSTEFREEDYVDRNLRKRNDDGFDDDDSTVSEVYSYPEDDVHTQLPKAVKINFDIGKRPPTP